MSLTLAILAILATWRASSALAEEDGPGDPGIFVLYRAKVSSRGPRWIRKGVSCVWCTSPWIGLLVAVYLTITGGLSLQELPIAWLGFSGGAILVHTILQGLLK